MLKRLSSVIDRQISNPYSTFYKIIYGATIGLSICAVTTTIRTGFLLKEMKENQEKKEKMQERAWKYKREAVEEDRRIWGHILDVDEE